MKYGIGQSIADFGFNFFEKIHEPIFLVHRLGKIVKINEAGRKFLCVAHLSASELEHFFSTYFKPLFISNNSSVRRIKTSEAGMHLIATAFDDSDFILVEVKK